MKQKHFYFIKDAFFTLVEDQFLMENKEPINGIINRRPCFYAFKLNENDRIMWMIPISSKTEKFHKIYENKILKYGKCDTIMFGKVLGYERAFLIQNMFPITEDYIQDEYLDRFGFPVKIDDSLSKKLVSNAKSIIKMNQNGIKLLFPDINKILDKINK